MGWKTWENGRIRMLVQEMNVPILDQETKKDRIRLIIDYFTGNRMNHQLYTLKFFFCEVLNLINVVGQIYFMDLFLGGEFTTYGLDVVSMTEMKNDERDDPMARVFPKVTKCTFQKFGPSGTVEKFDALPVAREILLRARARLASPAKIETICRGSGFGDWFILYQLGKNMDPMIFRDLINGLHKKLEILRVAERPMGS